MSSLKTLGLTGRLARTLVWMVAVSLWAVLLASSVSLFARFERTPGGQEVSPASWPTDSAIQPADAGRYTLVMFVHPRCPCSRASLAELNAIMRVQSERAAARIVFLKPGQTVAGWEHTDVWQSAGLIPGATRIVDWDGQEARRFGAETSGHLVVYDPNGAIVFTGGITSSRGQIGNNPGRQRVLELLGPAGRDRGSFGLPVFGCPLRTPPPQRARREGDRP